MHISIVMNTPCEKWVRTQEGVGRGLVSFPFFFHNERGDLQHMLKIVKSNQKWEQKTMSFFTFFQEDLTSMIIVT